MRNRTILEAIPQPPPYFFNLTRTQGGINVIGDILYAPSRESILHIFYRNRRLPPIRKRHHEFIIGCFLVLLIPILSDIVQTILLRSRSGQINFSGLHTAYLVDEFSYVRNIWAHLSSKQTIQRTSFRGSFRLRRVKYSLLALFVASFVFVADVVAVKLSQKVDIYSSATNFNLRAFQPIGTNRFRARQIRRQIELSPCVSPIVRSPSHVRNFVFSACILSESERDLDRKEDVSSDIAIGSWYHKGGSDHIISFGKARIRISIRAEIVSNGSIWRILFQTGRTIMEDTQYIHNRTIHAAMQFACNKRFSELNCEQMLDDLTVVSLVRDNRTIKLWERDGRDIEDDVLGLVSTFNVRMNQPFFALGNSTHYLMASSAIMDVVGNGSYENLTTGRRQTGIARLISEDGRTAGLPIIFFCFIIAAAVLAILRLWLNPVSLAMLATCHMRRRRRNSGSWG